LQISLSLKSLYTIMQLVHYMVIVLL